MEIPKDKKVLILAAGGGIAIAALVVLARRGSTETEEIPMPYPPVGWSSSHGFFGGGGSVGPLPLPPGPTPSPGVRYIGPPIRVPPGPPRVPPGPPRVPPGPDPPEFPPGPGDGPIMAPGVPTGAGTMTARDGLLPHVYAKEYTRAVLRVI